MSLLQLRSLNNALMKTYIATTLALLLTACAGSNPTTPTTPTAPTSNTAEVIALASLSASCAAAVPFVSVTTAKIIATCPMLVTTASEAIAADNYTGAAIIVTSGLQSIVAQLSASGAIPAADQKYTAAIIASATAFLTVWQALQPTSAVSMRAPMFDPARRSAADKKRLAEIKKEAAGAAKALRKRLKP